MDAKRRCPICKTAFVPKRVWQRYDKEACRRAAFVARSRDRIKAEVLAEIKAGKAR